MRQLKFRVWNPEQLKLEYFDLHNIVVSDNLLCQEKHPVQQFSGLQDLNGNDLYEGDIVSVNFFSPENYGVIKFGQYCGKDFYDQDSYGWFLDYGFDVYAFLKNWAKCSSIIGNIYENKELVKQ